MFHVSLLKPSHSGGDGQDALVPILVDGEVEYVVNSIVWHLISSVVRYYLVSFAGYDLPEAFWMSLS